jgi:4-alpha-glucanotransferase
MTQDFLTDILIRIHKADVREVMTLMPDWIGISEPINSPSGNDAGSWRRRSMPLDCTLLHLLEASRGHDTTQKAKYVYERVLRVRADSGRSGRDIKHHRDGTGGLLAGLISGDAYDCGIGDLHSWNMLIELAHNVGWNLLYLLPRNMSSYGNSPYSVLNDLKDIVDIDLEMLFEQFPKATEATKFWQSKEVVKLVDALCHSPLIDYDSARDLKIGLLRLVFSECRDKIDADKSFKSFCRKKLSLWQNQILHLILRNNFTSQKDFHNGWDWRLWPKAYRDSSSEQFKRALKENREEFEFQLFAQWIYKYQWDKLQDKANSYNIKTISDLPYMPPDAAVYDDFVKSKGKSKVFLIDDAGKRDFVSGVPADMFGPPQFWQGTIYNFANEAAWDYWSKRLEHEMEFSDEVRFDHGFGLFRVYYFTQMPLTWKHLRLWDKVVALRERGFSGDDGVKFDCARQLCDLVINSVRRVKELAPYQPYIFDTHTHKLTLDTSFFISQNASMRNIFESWLQSPNAKNQALAQNALNSIFNDYPHWRNEESDLFDEASGHNYFYRDVFNSQGEPDIYRGQLIMNLENRYNNDDTLLRQAVVDSGSFDNARFHDWCVVAHSNESKRNEHERAAYNYLFSRKTCAQASPEDKLVVSFFVYCGGSEKTTRIREGGEKLIRRLKGLAHKHGKDLVGEFLGASTAEIEKSLEKSEVCMFRVFQFGWPDKLENMNSPCRWSYLSHVIASVHDWYPLAGDKGLLAHKEAIDGWINV